MQPVETLHNMDLLVSLVLAMKCTHRGCTARLANAYMPCVFSTMMVLSGTTSLDAAFGAQCLVYR
jgi:hypothetical protein